SSWVVLYTSGVWSALYGIGNLHSAILTGTSFPSSRAVCASPSTQSEVTDTGDHRTITASAFQLLIYHSMEPITRYHATIPPNCESVLFEQFRKRLCKRRILMRVA